MLARPGSYADGIHVGLDGHTVSQLGERSPIDRPSFARRVRQVEAGPRGSEAERWGRVGGYTTPTRSSSVLELLALLEQHGGNR